VAGGLVELEGKGEGLLVGLLVESLGVDQRFVEVYHQGLLVCVLEVSLQLDLLD
jgi:hypothetical protein